MKFDSTHVKIHGAFIVWDGITRPEAGHDGKPKYSLKVVVNPNNPDLADMNELANSTLQTSKFRGQLPAGGRMPMGQARSDEFNGLYNGWVVLGCNTQRLPDVYDENGQKLDPMQYGNLLYGAQQVDVLVHCYEYDAKGNKGIATGLDAFAIIASANAVPQSFGGSGINTAGAFGGGAQQQAPVQQGGYAPQQQAPVQQAPVQQAPVQQAPVQQAPVQQAPVQQAPVQQAPVQQAPVQQAPVQQAPKDPVLMNPGLDYAAHIAANWTNETLIAANMATAHPQQPTQAQDFLPQ